eukprot:COSAG02_NODE_170_length_31534_cov_33.568498_15_plen_1274_part_00
MSLSGSAPHMLHVLHAVAAVAASTAGSRGSRSADGQVQGLPSFSVNVAPGDCGVAGSSPDCGPVLRTAVEKCRTHGTGCMIVLAPGSYRVACPNTYKGPYGYVFAPGAVDLSNTTGITFGAVSSAAPATLNIDYLQAGCPAVGATDASDVHIANVVLDTQRLPWTNATLTSSADGRSLRVAMTEPERSEWNLEKYPWLSWTDPRNNTALSGASSSSWDAATGIATLHFPSPHYVKNGTHIFTRHFRNMPSWGVYGLRVHGEYTLDAVQLLSAGGMGIRCDFCTGTFSFLNSAVVPAAGRAMSTTADGVHFMHHQGAIVMRNSTIAGTGDDCFNVHGNFIVISDILDRRHTLHYIDETGPGWFPGLGKYLVGDRVAFFSRLTLQQIGPENVLLRGSGGFGENASLTFRDPIPAGVLRYDMLISLDRIASLDTEGCTFLHGGRGMVISSVGVRIVNNTFENGFGGTTNSILFLEGGCGAYEDYTEGPFSSDILIADNSFQTNENGASELGYAADGAIQFAGCRPLGDCSHLPPGPAPAPSVRTPPDTFGPQPVGKIYPLAASSANYARAVLVTLPSKGNLSQLMYYDNCRGSPPVQGVSMGIYTDTGTGPGSMLSLAGHWGGGDEHCVSVGWRTAALRTPVQGYSKVWLVHWYSAGSWNTVQTLGTHHFLQLENVSGLPTSLASSTWKTYEASGVPLRVGLGSDAPPPSPAPSPPKPPSPAPSPPKPIAPGNTCSYNGEVAGGRCVCDHGWKGRVCDVLDERPTYSSAGYTAAANRSTWLGSVVRRGATNDYVLLVDDIQGQKCGGEPAYYLTATGFANGSNPLGPFTDERIISPQVTMHPTATIAPTGEIVVTSFTNTANKPLPSSTDCAAPSTVMPCALPAADCRPNKGYADANMTLQLLVGNASAPEMPWEHVPILTSTALPGKYSTDTEAIWGLWDPSHVILPSGETFVSTAHGNVTRGVFLFRAPHFRGPYSAVGSGPLLQFGGRPVQVCDPFLFYNTKRNALHIIANSCTEKGFPGAQGYVHAVASGPQFDNWTLTEGSLACLTDVHSSSCEHAIANTVALVGGGSIPFTSSRQSLTILFEEGTPIVAYTNLIGVRDGKKWTGYAHVSSLNAVPIGEKGSMIASKFGNLLKEQRRPADPPTHVTYPPCDPSGSTQPPVVKHPDSLYPGPGRITEKGEVLNQEGLTIFKNVTIRGNRFLASGRFLDIGAAKGIVVEHNVLVAPANTSSPSSNFRLYASTDFDPTSIETSNVCQMEQGVVKCKVSVVKTDD